MTITGSIYLNDGWESIVFLVFGLVVGEARHRELDLSLGN